MRRNWQEFSILEMSRRRVPLLLTILTRDLSETTSTPASRWAEKTLWVFIFFHDFFSRALWDCWIKAWTRSWSIIRTTTSQTSGMATYGKGSFRKQPLFWWINPLTGVGGSQTCPLTFGGPFLAFFGPFLSRFKAVLGLFTTQKICQ